MSEWFYKNADREVGPITTSELRSLISTGSIGPEAWVRKGRDGRWANARNLKGASFPTENSLPTLRVQGAVSPTNQITNQQVTGDQKSKLVPPPMPAAAPISTSIHRPVAGQQPLTTDQLEFDATLSRKRRASRETKLRIQIIVAAVIMLLVAIALAVTFISGDRRPRDPRPDASSAQSTDSGSESVPVGLPHSGKPVQDDAPIPKSGVSLSSLKSDPTYGTLNGSIIVAFESQIKIKDLTVQIETLNRLATIESLTSAELDQILNEVRHRMRVFQLPDVFAIQIACDHVAFRIASRESAEELPLILDANLRVNAANSEAASRMGLARRLRDSAGMKFDPASTMANYLAAIETPGKLTFTNANGEMQSVALSLASFRKMLVESGVEPNRIDTLLGQQYTNQGHLTGTQIGIARLLQGDELGQLLLAPRIRSILARALAAAGVEKRVAAQSAGTISKAIGTGILGLDPAALAVPVERAQAIGQLIEAEIAKTPDGKAVLAQIDASGQRNKALQQLGDAVGGGLDNVVRGVRGLSDYESLNNLLLLQNADFLKNAIRIKEEQAAGAAASSIGKESD